MKEIIHADNIVEVHENKIDLHLKRTVDESYSIDIGENILSKVVDFLQIHFSGKRCAVVTETKVDALHGDKLRGVLQEAHIAFSWYVFPEGELSKTENQATQLKEQMGLDGLNKGTPVIAFGGGVVGDLIGYVAATFLRGLPFIQIPTTLLSMVDSAIGGKNGVDLKAGKNLSGVIKQPDYILVDVTFLQTLDEVQLRSGLAEVIKYGIIDDSSFFTYLESNVDFILRKEPKALLHIVRHCCVMKAKVVVVDPHEHGIRRVLNFGHTLGHATERASLDKVERGEIVTYIPHGICVSFGMVYAAHVSKKMGLLSSDDVLHIELVLQKYGLPIQIPKGYDFLPIRKCMNVDKKAVDGTVQFCLAKQLGKMESFGGSYRTIVDDTIIEETFYELQEK